MMPDDGRKGLTLVEVLVVVLVLVLLVGLLLPAIQHARESARRSSCIGGNSKKFALGLHNYHDVFGMFPPAYIADDAGRPVHSWRILVLPYLGAETAYEKYDFASPWHSAANRSLIDSLGSYPYKCPSAPPENATMTDFLAVVGRDTVWPPDGSCVRIPDISDGTTNTIQFGEVDGSGIHRAEPRDFHTLQMSFEVNPTSGQGFSSPHPGIAFAIFADGSVKALRTGISEEIVRAMVTRNGGETVKPHEEGRELF
jgi:hypothetical protein